MKQRDSLRGMTGSVLFADRIRPYRKTAGFMKEEGEVMKVFGICCGRKGGNTEIMMQDVFAGVKAVCPDAECSFVNLQDAEIKHCIGCETCMSKKLEGDFEFRCVHGIDQDHFHFIETRMREADAIIVSAPAYNLLPPGIMMRFLNKMHASGDYRRSTQGVDICKVGACFSIGGTDWTDYMPNVMRMITMELVGVYDGVVDSVHFDFETARQAVLLDTDVLARMRQMGETVAKAVLYKKETGKNAEYAGMEGLCPYCHSNLLRVNSDGNAYCPQCNVKATVSVSYGKVKVDFLPEDVKKSRWGVYGQDLHMRNIGIGHRKAVEGKETINRMYNESYKERIAESRLSFPSLK